jgi:hypothetical protein
LPERDRRRVFALVAGVKFFLALARRNLHDADGVADHISGALLSFGASGHRSH